MEVIAQRGEGVYLIGLSETEGFILNMEEGTPPSASEVMHPEAIIKFGYWAPCELDDDGKSEVLARARMIGPAQPSQEQEEA